MAEYKVYVTVTVDFEVEADSLADAEDKAFSQWWEHKHNAYVDSIDVEDIEEDEE